MVCSLIFVSYPNEYQAVRVHLKTIYEETHLQGTVYTRGEFSAGEHIWKVAIAQVNPTNVDAAVEVERAINSRLILGSE